MYTKLSNSGNSFFLSILKWTNMVSKRDTFSPFVSLSILLLVFPSNFIISGVNPKTAKGAIPPPPMWFFQNIIFRRDIVALVFCDF